MMREKEMPKMKEKKMPKEMEKFKKVMHEFDMNELHSGKSDKKVSSLKQALAIAFSEKHKAKRGM